MYWLTGIAGAILMAAPYMFSYADNLTALWTSLIAGFVVIVLSVWEGMETKQANWEYWMAGFVGLLAVLAPFVLGFGSAATAMWSTVILGAVIAVLAVSKIWIGGSSRV